MNETDRAFISEFAAFCRTKGDEGYDYWDTLNCAVAQFVRASGKGVSAGGLTWADNNNKRHLMPDGFVTNGNRDGVIISLPHTFSALADRLEALLTDAPEVARS